MAHLIDKAAVIAEIERRLKELAEFPKFSYETGLIDAYMLMRAFLDTLEVKEVDLEKESELIANGIMIGVQANKYHTCVYNTARCDFNHSHLMFAARKGIELGLKAKKGE